MKAAGPEVTLKVALTLAPGATGSANVFDVLAPGDDGGPLLAGHGEAQAKPAAGAPVVFVNVTVVSCEEPGENI